MAQVKLVFLILVTTLTSAKAEEANKIQTIESRIEELEKRHNELFVQVNRDENRVRPFLGSEIAIGGFFESVMVHIDGPNMETQTTFASHVLGINLAAKVSDRDRFVGQLQTGLGYNFINRHSDPRVTAAPQRTFSTATAPTLLAHAYYEHSFSPVFNVQTGLGYVPFGKAYREREPFLLMRRGSVQMISHSATSNSGTSSVGVAFPLWMGVHVHGAFENGPTRWGYNLYTFSPTTNTRTVGGGARLWTRLSESFTFGLSGQTGEQTKHDYRSFGADLDVKLLSGGFIVEYAESTSTGNGPSMPKSYYILPYIYAFNQEWVFFGVADYLDNPSNVTATSGFPSDPYEKWDYGAGVNWLPRKNVRIRAIYTDHQYGGENTVIAPNERDYYSLDLSAVVAF